MSDKPSDTQEFEEFPEIEEAPEPMKPTRKGKASAPVEVHYVAQCIINFVNTHSKDDVKPAESALLDLDLSDDNLRSILENELTPETNHIIRWLLKISYAKRTEWQA
jgi:hypothetical protein